MLGSSSEFGIALISDAGEDIEPVGVTAANLLDLGLVRAQTSRGGVVVEQPPFLVQPLVRIAGVAALHITARGVGTYSEQQLADASLAAFDDRPILGQRFFAASSALWWECGPPLGE